MSSPPPWQNIEGISRAAMKDNTQVTAAEYDGSARPAELVVEQNSLQLYVGDNNGNLVLLAHPGGHAANIRIYDEGVLLTNAVASLDFVGGGVTVTEAVGDVTITIPNTAVTILDEGISLTAAANSMNFVGEGVTTTNSGNAVTVSIPHGGIGTLYNGSFYADGSTTLTAGINSNTTSPLAVSSTAGFFSSGYLRLGTEVIRYTGKTATTFTGITRGAAGSNASTHSLGDGVGAAQYIGGAGLIGNVLIESTSVSNGVTLDATTGIVTVVNAGTYNCQFSVQTECYGNTPDDTVIWFMQNGNIVPASSSYSTVPAVHAGEPGGAIITVNLFLICAANDTINLRWMSIGGKTAITTIPPVNSNIPASPGVIFTINRIY